MTKISKYRELYGKNIVPDEKWLLEEIREIIASHGCGADGSTVDETADAVMEAVRFYSVKKKRYGEVELVKKIQFTFNNKPAWFCVFQQDGKPYMFYVYQGEGSDFEFTSLSMEGEKPEDPLFQEKALNLLQLCILLGL